MSWVVVKRRGDRYVAYMRFIDEEDGEEVLLPLLYVHVEDGVVEVDEDVEVYAEVDREGLCKVLEEVEAKLLEVLGGGEEVKRGLRSVRSRYC